MTTIVVDTNIVFSALLSPDGKIIDLLLNSEEEFEFFTPTFMIDELENHHEKLKKISGFDDDEIKFLKRVVFNRINFIDPELIRPENWDKAINVVKEIDEKDAPFVALTLEMGGFLWTGDKKLRNGLEEKGLDWILGTTEVFTKRGK